MLEYEKLANLSLYDRPARLSWPRTHKFSLSPEGVEAESSYRECVVVSRAENGRASFDAARTLWAEKLSLDVDDGLYLAEIGNGPVNLAKIIEALDACGKSRADAIRALERLMARGMVSPV